jgi:Uma2 family endonuclease
MLRDDPWYRHHIMVPAKIPGRMTVDQFLKWDSEDGRRYELVDGKPRAMAPASAIHGFLQNELGRLIGNHLRDRQLAAKWLLILASFLGFCPSIMSGFRT